MIVCPEAFDDPSGLIAHHRPPLSGRSRQQPAAALTPRPPSSPSSLPSLIAPPLQPADFATQQQPSTKQQQQQPRSRRVPRLPEVAVDEALRSILHDSRAAGGGGGGGDGITPATLRTLFFASSAGAADPVVEPSGSRQRRPSSTQAAAVVPDAHAANVGARRDDELVDIVVAQHAERLHQQLLEKLSQRRNTNTDGSGGGGDDIEQLFSTAVLRVSRSVDRAQPDLARLLRAVTTAAAATTAADGQAAVMAEQQQQRVAELRSGRCTKIPPAYWVFRDALGGFAATTSGADSGGGAAAARRGIAFPSGAPDNRPEVYFLAFALDRMVRDCGAAATLADPDAAFAIFPPNLNSGGGGENLAAVEAASAAACTRYVDAATALWAVLDAGLSEVVRQVAPQCVERAALLDALRAAANDTAATLLDVAAHCRARAFEEARVKAASDDLLLQKNRQVIELRARVAELEAKVLATEAQRDEFALKAERFDLLVGQMSHKEAQKQRAIVRAGQDAALRELEGSLARSAVSASMALQELGALRAAPLDGEEEDDEDSGRSRSGVFVFETAAARQQREKAEQENRDKQLMYTASVDMLRTLRRAVDATDAVCETLFSRAVFATPELSARVAAGRWAAIATAVGQREVQHDHRERVVKALQKWSDAQLARVRSTGTAAAFAAAAGVGGGASNATAAGKQKNQQPMTDGGGAVSAATAKKLRDTIIAVQAAEAIAAADRRLSEAEDDDAAGAASSSSSRPAQHQPPLQPSSAALTRRATDDELRSLGFVDVTSAEVNALLEPDVDIEEYLRPAPVELPANWGITAGGVAQMLSDVTATFREVVLRLNALSDSKLLLELAKPPLLPPEHPEQPCALCGRRDRVAAARARETAAVKKVAAEMEARVAAVKQQLVAAQRERDDGQRALARAQAAAKELQARLLELQAPAGIAQPQPPPSFISVTPPVGAGGGAGGKKEQHQHRRRSSNRSADAAAAVVVVAANATPTPLPPQTPEPPPIATAQLQQPPPPPQERKVTGLPGRDGAPQTVRSEHGRALIERALALAHGDGDGRSGGGDAATTVSSFDQDDAASEGRAKSGGARAASASPGGLLADFHSSSSNLQPPQLAKTPRPGDRVAAVATLAAAATATVVVVPSSPATSSPLKAPPQQLSAAAAAVKRQQQQRNAASLSHHTNNTTTASSDDMFGGSTAAAAAAAEAAVAAHHHHSSNNDDSTTHIVEIAAPAVVYDDGDSDSSGDDNERTAHHHRRHRTRQTSHHSASSPRSAATATTATATTNTANTMPSVDALDTAEPSPHANAATAAAAAIRAAPAALSPPLQIQLVINCRCCDGGRRQVTPPAAVIGVSPPRSPDHAAAAMAATAATDPLMQSVAAAAQIPSLNETFGSPTLPLLAITAAAVAAKQQQQQQQQRVSAFADVPPPPLPRHSATSEPFRTSGNNGGVLVPVAPFSAVATAGDSFSRHDTNRGSNGASFTVVADEEAQFWLDVDAAAARALRAAGPVSAVTPAGLARVVSDLAGDGERVRGTLRQLTTTAAAAAAAAASNNAADARTKAGGGLGPAPSPRAPVKPLGWLLRWIAQYMRAKFAADAVALTEGREQLSPSAFLYAFLRQQLGASELVADTTHAILLASEAYGAEDPRVGHFGRVLTTFNAQLLSFAMRLSRALDAANDSLDYTNGSVAAFAADDDPHRAQVVCLARVAAVLRHTQLTARPYADTLWRSLAHGSIATPASESSFRAAVARYHTLRPRSATAASATATRQPVTSAASAMAQATAAAVPEWATPPPGSAMTVEQATAMARLVVPKAIVVSVACVFEDALMRKADDEAANRAAVAARARDGRKSPQRAGAMPRNAGRLVPRASSALGR